MSNELRNFLLRIPFWAVGAAGILWAVSLAGWLPVLITLGATYAACIKITVTKS